MKTSHACDRCCKEKITTHTWSMFNQEMLCIECSETEKNHPMYTIAREIEAIHVRLGNLNYEGIGLPKDYQSWLEEHQKSSNKKQ